jgi:hypothetical protein
VANLAADEAPLSGTLTREMRVDRWAPLLAVTAPVALLVIGLAAFSPALVTQDFWLAVVSGREIAEHGLPHVDHLTVMASGHRWVDQQWLAQLLLYEVARLGVGAAAAVCLLCVAAALGIVGLIAYRRGASPGAILGFLVFCVAAAPWGMQLRPQALALPLFALTLFLLARDPRARRNSTLWVLPMLCLWANLHGSAVLGALLLIVYSAQALVRGAGRTARLRALACLVLAAPALQASPYATSLPGYYRLMLLDPPFGREIREWHRTTPSGLTAVFFALLVVAVVLVATRRRRLDLFDLLVLGLTLITGLEAIRGIVWFGLACAAFLPALATRRPGESRLEGRPAELLTWTAAAATLAAIVFVAVRPANAFSTRLPRATADAVAARTASGHALVYADDSSADELLWRLPSLRGRVAYDVRFELLTKGQIARLVRWDRLDPGWQRATAGYSLVVADPKHITALVATGGWRRLVAGPNVEVAVRRGAQTTGQGKPDVPAG